MVVIGGGVIGTSAAFHLSEAGVEVVLVERGQLGSGSTSRAAGGVRTQFSDVLNIEIAKRSLAAFRDFARRPGWEIDLEQVGYLFVITREDDLEAFEQSVDAAARAWAGLADPDPDRDVRAVPAARGR